LTAGGAGLGSANSFRGDSKPQTNLRCAGQATKFVSAADRNPYLSLLASPRTTPQSEPRALLEDQLLLTGNPRDCSPDHWISLGFDFVALCDS
jgi:hypothetical protein